MFFSLDNLLIVRRLNSFFLKIFFFDGNNLSIVSGYIYEHVFFVKNEKSFAVFFEFATISSEYLYKYFTIIFIISFLIKSFNPK